jgi:aspartyl-tRNA(Asn)/glutamyl-tRNA(Gln) amidotransferase subunit A
VSEPLWRISLSELSRRLRAREVSPVEAVRTCLDRIDAHNARLRALITVTAEQALAQAREAEADLLAGRSRGALHGVPIVHKDLVQTRGIRTTAGSKILADWVPETDAPVAVRWREAGTIVVGKANLHEFAFGPTSVNPHHGPVRNPWNTERVSGGSSGGSAVAVATGMAWGATGTDTGGSIRIPAALCGVVGLKPTYGRVSREGVVPLSWSLDHVGPIARTVTDTALLFEAMADPGPDGASFAMPDLENPEVKGLRLGICRAYFEGGDPGIEACVREAVRALEKIGARVVEIEIPSIAVERAAEGTILVAEAAAYHEESIRARAEDFGMDVRLYIMAGLTVPAVSYLKAQRARATLGAELSRALETCDAIVCPAAGVPAPPLDAMTVRVGDRDVEIVEALSRFTFLANLVGWPAISVPCGRVDGLPAGLQILAPPFHEARALTIARAYEIDHPFEEAVPLEPLG